MGWMFKSRSTAGPDRPRGVIAAAAAGAALLGLTGCERWALDRQMEELCKKDGGLKVYEKEKLPAGEFSNVGQPLAKYASQAKSLEERLGPDYRYVVERVVVAGNPAADPQRGQGLVQRVHESVIRRSDSKVLGESIWYARSGGDFFTFGRHPSGSRCPVPSLSVISSIFIKEE